jgi:aminoglycoside phosphotransferase family enzyme/predicted kinase
VDLSTLIDALRDPAAYPHPGLTVEVVHTHASVVFLVGELAYKVKKPVDLGFLDYSTLSKRERMCQAEVELNARLAPEVYLGVVPIVVEGDRVRVEGAGTPIEFAVKMVRLPDHARLGERLRAGDVAPASIDALALRLARFHREARRSAEIAAMADYAVVERNCVENLEQLQPSIGSALSEAVHRRLEALTRQELAAQRSRIRSRARAGVGCETHGDLRLEHVYLFPDREPPHDLCIVDCIEFNERFRFADPIADIAFLVMDLRAHDARAEADRLVERYIDASGDHDGAALLPLYTAYRATVRGKVRAMQAAEPEVPEAARRSAMQAARGHLLQAVGELAPPGERPCLLLMCGLPGTGKSVLAQQLAEQAGFTVVRSDVTRKRLAGLQPGESGGTAPAAGIYAADFTERTYRACAAEAERRLFEGERVIVDATFRDEEHRTRFVDLARRCMVPVRILHCWADPELVHDRLDRRQGDPSDADWGVYQHMRGIWEPFGADVADLVDTIETSASPQEVGRRGIEALRRHALADTPAGGRRVA